MERDTSNDPADTLATRPNGRTSAPLVINRNGSRKDLFGGRQQQPNENNRAETASVKGNHARASSASLSPDHRTNSPNSRIPRPKSNSPRPFSIRDAYRMAIEAEEAEEAAQGSPSPAPRTWRSRTDSGESRPEKSPSQSQARGSRRRTGSGRVVPAPPGRRGANSPIDSLEADVHGKDDSDSDIDHKINLFGKEQQHQGGADARVSSGSNGLFAKSRLGPKVAETGKELSRKASNGSLDAAPSSTGYRPWGLKAKSSSGWVKHALSSPDKHDDNLGADAPPSAAPLGAPTPNKSFAWDADADFTAGDLLVSDSPPLKTRTGNSNAGSRRTSSPPRYRNTKIDEIRALEIEAAVKYPAEAPQPSDENDPLSHWRSSGSIETHSPPSRPLNRTNTKLDEIRAREIESLSRRAVATARLDEIRERNSAARSRSRSSSPEIPRQSSKEVFRESPLVNNEPSMPNTNPILDDGERIPNTPVTIFRKPSPESRHRDDQDDNKHPGTQAASQNAKRDPISREDSQDLLRRLARAASTSPAPAQQAMKSNAKDPQDPTVDSEKDANLRLPRRERNVDKGPDRSKAVGFAGLRREPSAESISDKSDKRSSLALSENDPTERIEREMQLFAPLDNHSERGSIRAPSPESDKDDDVEETPRPVKTDPTMLPTPKVTGAYIETPATVKVERLEEFSVPEIVELGPEGTASGPSSGTRGRKVEISLRKPSQTSSAEGDRAATRSKSQSRSDRRARSLPRARSPLINSARPPTVKDDLLEIQRTYQIEDSTLDDLDGFFAAQDQHSDPALPKLEPEPEPIKIEITETRASVTDQKNSKTINRIGRSLESIRTARKGIERLEDEFSKAKELLPKVAVTESAAPHPHHLIDPNHIMSTCPTCLAQSPGSMVAYVHVPLPRLWRRKPTFRLTFLGLVVSILSLWYLAESTVCSFYCKPQYCYPGKPCNWSHDDPFWGYAIPVKLDQWTTGGQGRALVRKVRPEIADWVADVWDVVTGTDIRTVDTRGYDWEQRRQHRRRLMKRGLVKPPVERPEDRDKYEAWRRARIAKEEADARREMGYDDDGAEERMAADERVR